MALHGKPRVGRCFGLGVPQHSVRGGVNDDRGVRAVPRQDDTQPARVGSERWSVAIASEWMQNDNGFGYSAARGNDHVEGHIASAWAGCGTPRQPGTTGGVAPVQLLAAAAA